MYLGVKSLLAKRPHKMSELKGAKVTRISDKRAFFDGFIANVLNQKFTLFMLSIFTLMVKPNTPIFIQFTYGVEIALIAISWFVFLSFALKMPVALAT
jgi:threonine/homoserine/homoserine lactone efflux protein